MKWLAVLFSASGRIAPKRFAVGAAVVYGIAFLSQLLIAPPVMLRAGLAPFALVQALAIWAWFCLHAKRLRDAGRDIGPALAIAGLYALAIILLLLMVALVMPLGEAVKTPDVDSADVLISSYLIAAVTGDLGLFAYVVAGILALIFTPMLIAIAFSIWAGTRHSVASVAPRCVSARA
jgi:uncharacterized membrane protein YhaH (DUF805 family)